MQIGFNAPTAGPMSATDQLVRLVVEAESLGYDYATVSDHVVIPTDIAAKYPYSNTGEFPAGSRAERHEQLIEMAFIAAKKLRLVSSVMVVPHRPAVLTAKMLATIDVLSGGRLTVGIGAGWMKEEFEAIQAPDFAARGEVTDEYIKAFIELWTNPNPKFAGKHVRFDTILLDQAQAEPLLAAYHRYRSKAAQAAIGRAGLGMWFGTWTGKPLSVVRDFVIRHLLCRGPVKRHMGPYYAMLTIPYNTIERVPVDALKSQPA